MAPHRSPEAAGAPPPPAAAPVRHTVLVAIEAGGGAPAVSLQTRIADHFPSCSATVLVAVPGNEPPLVDPRDAPPHARSPEVPGLATGGIDGRLSALSSLLEEADRRGAAVAALLSSGRHDDAVDWIALLLGPILDGSFDFARPTYLRERLDAMLNTAIAYPLVRALFGQRLRQPIGGEAAVSLELARALRADPAWRRDPAHAGSDAWLVATVLASRFRVCQAWLGRRPGDASAAEDASHALARVVGPIFREMERHAEHWQRVEGSASVPSVGIEGLLDERRADVDVAPLEEAFRLGRSELEPLWGLVLPPATLLSLRRAAAAAAGRLWIDDALWARIVYDFAVAHSIRTVERQQLLRSMTPLYLGWTAGFAKDVRGADASGVEARVEALCLAFEREKPYAVARWRWPDGFNP